MGLVVREVVQKIKGTSGGGGGYLRGSRGTHNHQAGGGGGGTYYSGEDCSGLSSRNIKMTALCKLMNGWTKFKTLLTIIFGFLLHILGRAANSGHSSN